MGKTPTSFRLSDKAKYLLRLLSRELAVSQSAVLEIIIRDEAQEKGIEADLLTDWDEHIRRIVDEHLERKNTTSNEEKGEA